MYEWKVNEIKVNMMERVLNHMEKQGYQVQTIIPLFAVKEEAVSEQILSSRTMLLAGRKEARSSPGAGQCGMPAVKPENLDLVYGGKKE
jgi:hypothetical protein